MRPNKESALPGAHFRRSLGEEDGGILIGKAPASKQIQCLSCQHLFTRRDGGQLSDLLCEPCEEGQPNVSHLKGGDDE